MTNKTHAPGQLLGYMLQVRHMMFELISLDPDHVVSVEAFDDVATQVENGIVVQQLKSVLSENSPISNRSIDFWKTLNNWLSYVKEGSLSINNTIFRMIIIANRGLEPGNLIAKMFEAKTDAEATAALQLAKDTLWGKDDFKKSEVAKSYGPFLEAVFCDANKNTVISIIKKIELIVFNSNYNDNLYTKFCAQLIDDRFQDKFFLLMLGWVNERVTCFLQQKKTAFIKCEEFRKELLKHTSNFRENTLLAAASLTIKDDEKRNEIDKQDIYIKQLGFIEVEIEEKLSAASDFLRTKSTKIDWAERGIVNNLDDYNAAIVRSWNNNKQLVKFTPNLSDVMAGKKLYFECQRDVQKIRVQNCDPPEFFGSGTLHALANMPSDGPQIGWHLQYKKLLKQEKE